MLSDLCMGGGVWDGAQCNFTDELFTFTDELFTADGDGLGYGVIDDA